MQNAFNAGRQTVDGQSRTIEAGGVVGVDEMRFLVPAVSLMNQMVDNSAEEFCRVMEKRRRFKPRGLKAATPAPGGQFDPEDDPELGNKSDVEIIERGLTDPSSEVAISCRVALQRIRKRAESACGGFCGDSAVKNR